MVRLESHIVGTSGITKQLCRARPTFRIEGPKSGSPLLGFKGTNLSHLYNKGFNYTVYYTLILSALNSTIPLLSKLII